MAVATEARDEKLQLFFDTLSVAVLGRTGTTEPAARAATLIFNALKTPGRPGTTTPNRLPVCTWLPQALAISGEDAPDAIEHAAALAALEPSFTWKRRTASEGLHDGFATGHANATIAGPGGLEERSDLRIGVSLLGPDVQYPDHQHPPEEIYLALSPGSWRQNQGSWHEPGLGGIVYNPPNIVHAMRSGGAPLLATWCLWSGPA